MRLFLSLLAFLSQPVLADQSLVEKTVKAVVGTWVGTTTLSVTGRPDESFENKIVCRVIASGAGAECSSVANPPGFMELTQTCLLAFDAATNAVHYMCVSNLGEVHDHKGTWVSPSEIRYEPYVGSVNGEQVTELVSTAFPDAFTIVHVSTIKSEKDGEISFKFTGKKVSE